MDLSLFFMKISQFSADDPEAFAKFLSERVMNRLENQIQKRQELQKLQQQIDDGEFDSFLNEESLFLKSRGGK